MFQQTYHFSKIWHNQWLSEDELKEMQRKKLCRMVEHAYETVPYYHRLFKENGLRPEDIVGVEDLDKIPITTKQMVKQAGKDMLSRNFNIERLVTKTTSGSTGKPLRLYKTKSSIHLSAAAKLRTFIINGYKPTYKIAVLRGFMTRKKFFHLFGIHREYTIPFQKTLDEQVDLIRKITPEVLEALPSRVEQLAKYLKKSGEKIGDVKIIFTLAENLSNSSRKIIKDMFGINPVNTYGSNEFPNIAFECPFHEGLHIHEDLLFLESIPGVRSGNATTDRNDFGSVVITDFKNPAMPLIRYTLGDLIVLSKKKCACGRTFSLIKEIVGRTNEFMILPSGEKISGLIALRSLREYPEIEQYRGVQKKDGGLLVRIKLEQGKEIPETKIKNEIQELCKGLVVTIELVDQIDQGPEGKLIEFQSELI